MKCPSEVEINEFVEGRLETTRRWQVERHLTECAACRREVEGLRKLETMLEALTVAPEGADQHPSPEALAALVEGTADERLKSEVLTHLGQCAECASLLGHLPRSERRAHFPLAWTGVAAAAAAVLIAVGFYFVAPRQAARGPLPTAASVPAPAGPVPSGSGSSGRSRRDSAAPGRRPRPTVGQERAARSAGERRRRSWCTAARPTRCGPIPEPGQRSGEEDAGPPGRTQRRSCARPDFPARSPAPSAQAPGPGRRAGRAAST